MTQPDNPAHTPLDALVAYVADARPDEQADRLTFAASEAARIVALGGTSRVAAITRLSLAAQIAGYGLRDAETIIGVAFAGTPR